MVVGDDHVDAALQGVVRLVDGGDAAVNGDDERDVVGALEARDRVHVQAVALLDAVGDVRVHGHAAAAQIVREHARRRDAVDVVVAEDGHVLPPLNGGADARDGFVHVLQEHGVERALVAAAEKIARLPGIGSKSAQRLAFFVLSLPEEEAKAFADAIVDAKRTVTFCPVCRNLTDGGLCPICSSPKRDEHVICVVADPRDVVAIERAREYNTCCTASSRR